MAFDKKALLGIKPEPWPDDPLRLQRFATWLGRRAARDAIPDPVVDAFVKPLGSVIDRLKKRQPGVYRAFNESVRDMRIRLPERDAPPFLINMVLLLGEELSSEGDDAINDVLRRLRTKLKPSEAALGEVLRLTANRMSVAQLDATLLVDLEAYSYEGGNQVGAQPSPL